MLPPFNNSIFKVKFGNEKPTVRTGYTKLSEITMKECQFKNTLELL